MEERWLIYVNNTETSDSIMATRGIGNNNNSGVSDYPLATADEAFRRLPPSWSGRAEIIFAPSPIPYVITKSAIYFGTPIGPDASPLVLRGGYKSEFYVAASRSNGTGNQVVVGSRFDADQLLGRVLRRGSDSVLESGPAVSIRGNTNEANSTIFLQRNIGAISEGDRLVVQGPSVTLQPERSLTLTSHDGRSPNLILIGIQVAPRSGQQLNLLNVRVMCETCEFLFNGASCFVHTNSRIHGGFEAVDVAPGMETLRTEAGVYIHSNDRSNAISAVRGGILGGHLTFRSITVRASQGGVFVPKSLEACDAPIRIMAGGSAIAEPQREGSSVVGGWGIGSNKARIRNVHNISGDPGDGLRVSNGGAINSPQGPIHLNIFGCDRDGIRLDGGAFAAFGPPCTRDSTGTEIGGETGLVTTPDDHSGAAINSGAGLNVRNASRALVGPDTNLQGRVMVMLDDGENPGEQASWGNIDRSNSLRNDRQSLVCLNTN